jgi:hypothetical protein
MLAAYNNRLGESMTNSRGPIANACGEEQRRRKIEGPGRFLHATTHTSRFYRKRNSRSMILCQIRNKFDIILPNKITSDPELNHKIKTEAKINNLIVFDLLHS